MRAVLDQQDCVRNDEATQAAFFLVGVNAFDWLTLLQAAVHIVAVYQREPKGPPFT